MKKKPVAKKPVKDSVYRKPPPKKMPRKSGIVMKELDSKDMPTSTIHHNLTPDWETKEKDKSAIGKIRVTDKGTKYIVKEAAGPEKKSEDKKEFGTPSSLNARHGKKYPRINASYEESQWIANPDLDRPTTAYSGMTKRELENLGRKYGVEIDRRLKRSTIIRLIELAEEAHLKEVASAEDPVQRMILQAIAIGMAIGLFIGALFGYALGIA